MPHALLRYGDLTASGIAGGRVGLNVDSAVARAATKSDEKINIVAMNSCTKNGLQWSERPQKQQRKNMADF
jgi:hypothetical protein